MIPDTTDDAVLADMLRREDPEQFYTLVRMHLSFVLDLNTDECDGSAEKPKFRPLKWGFPRKTKPKEPAETVSLTAEAMERIFKLIEWLSEEKNVTQEGIFRRSGKMTRQQELRNLLNSRAPLVLSDGRFSVHDGASVLKNVLAQLPECLLTEAHYPAHCQIAELCQSSSSGGKLSEGEEERLLRALQLMLLLLPNENLALLRDLMKLLHLTASHVAQNKMSADNLATLFTPHLLCPRRLTPEALHTNSQILTPVLSFMIVQGPSLFHIPTQLATDIRAYWTARQEKGVNESVCDGMAAKTVFTFVDRERTAEANAATNPTEAALAQLYAHIQSLPESSKKKKLIKQFNKENGQGTPQLQEKGERMSRARQCYSATGPRPRARSRSIGDSIKKHMPVFNKAPKRRKDCNEQPQTKESPCSGSPATKTKSPNDDNASEESSMSIPGAATGSATMPPLKKALLKGNSSSETTLRVRLSANTNRTPLAVLAQNTLSQNSSCSPKRCPTSSGSSSEDSSTSTPFPVPVVPDPQHLKQQSGSDVIWPVSTASAASSSSPAGVTNLLTTPRNGLPWITSTPACNRPLDATNPNSCLLTPSNVTGNDSMSPITQSAQRMPKAMQENMMTPRSRKPVVALSSSNLCQLAHLSGWGPSGTGELLRDATNRATLLSDKNSRNVPRKLAMMHEESFADLQSESLNLPDEKNASEKTGDLHTDTLQNKLCTSANSCDKQTSLSVNNSSCSGESAITGTFRDYLMSRSVLTASPVDLSFSSRTGDFDTSSDREMKMILSGDTMSDSLLYCLDGNEPENMQCDDEKSENNEEKKGNLGSESGSSGVEAGDDGFGSENVSVSPSVNTGRDSTGVDSLTDKSLEQQCRSGVKCLQNQLPLCLEGSFPFAASTDDRLNAVGIGVPEGCLANVSASLV